MKTAFVIFMEADAAVVATVRNEVVALEFIQSVAAKCDDSMAEQVAERMRQAGYSGEPVMLALPAQGCLCASISTDDLPRQHRRDAMLYRLEDQLPLAAEDIVSDFVPTHPRSLAVCVQYKPIEDLVEYLQARGIEIQCICPTGILAGQYLGSLAPYGTAAGLWANEHALELLLETDGKPNEWYHLPVADSDLKRHLLARFESQESPRKIHCFKVQTEIQAEVMAAGAFELVIHSEGLYDCAALCASRILAMQQPALIELRRGALASADPYRRLRNPLLAAVMSLLLFALSCSAACFWRARGYREMNARIHSQQQMLFQEVLPTSDLPTSVRLRLASEERKLRGLSGASAQFPTSPSALNLLYETLRRLPTDMRFRILELRIAPERVYIEGQARSHSDVDAIASALGSGSIFDVEQPRTERLKEKGVSFILCAELHRSREGSAQL
jgi:type II secretory pathway component PulL